MLQRTHQWTFLLVALTAGCADRPLYVPLDGATDMPRDGSLPQDALPPDPCVAGNEFIFTLGADSTLSRFDPARNLFFDVGPLACPMGASGPNSMAVDNSGTAWVTLVTGDLLKVNTVTASCAATPFVPGQDGFTAVGMSFAENAPGSSDETLWVIREDGTELASIDLSTLTLSAPVTTNASSFGELTGDDQGNLWGFFPGDMPPFIARIDKVAGTIDRQLPLPDLSGNPRAWGLAAWHSDFYVFLEHSDDPSSSIYHVDGTTGVVTRVVADTGREIIGVGVATCASRTADMN